MRTSFAYAGMLALSLVQAVGAQEFKPPANLFGQKTPAPKPPTVDWNWRPSTPQGQAAKPSVVCGMTVIPADPKIDPKIAMKPTDTGTRYTLKVVEPTVCQGPQR